MNQEIDSNIQTLIQKYAGGCMPPLVNINDSKWGLISNDLLQVYKNGFTRKYSTPMGMLLPAPNLPEQQRWVEGDYALNKWCMPEWSELCLKLREKPEGNKICETCDRRQAILAENQKDVVVYMCDNGLIDFAIPILVKKQVTAILFCGQFKPSAGSLWNPEMLQSKGLFRLLKPGERGIDLQAESQKRINSVESLLQLQGLSKLQAREINPEEVVKLQDGIRKSSKDLSDLATSTYELEKAKIVDWIQKHITHVLSYLSTKAASTSEVWGRLPSELAYVAGYFGVDYILILSLYDDVEKTLRLLSQSGLPGEEFPVGLRIRLTAGEYKGVAPIFSQKPANPVSSRLQGFAGLPLLGRLSHFHEHRKSNQVLVIPTLTPITSASTVVIIGRRKKDTNPDTFSDDDREAIKQVANAITMVVEIVLLVEQLEETAKKQERFLEDVAHDIRTPIQNLIVQSEALNRSINVDGAKQIGQEMATQARRLNRMSEKFWTMVRIDRGLLDAEVPEPVHVYQALTEHRKFLLELAEKRGIQIWIDKTLENWTAIRVHKTLFLQAVLNLMDNALKYSRNGSEIRIDGRSLPDGITLNFVNRGIPIHEEEKDKIFDRYYRTNDARMVASAGTGIGLYIVKWFIERAKGNIKVKSDPIPGTRDYLTIFELFIPQSKWR